MRPLRTVVGAIIVDSLEHPTRVAAARRSEGDDALNGYWEFPGGKLEPGETRVAALARELAEELSLVVEIGDEFPRGGRPGATWPIGEALELALYFTVIREGELAPGPVHDAVIWLEPAELQSVAWLPSDAEAVASLQRALVGALRAQRPQADRHSPRPT